MTDDRRLTSIRWDLDEDGGGTAEVFFVDGGQLVEIPYEFESLSELPSDVARRIREDGRPTGQIGG